MPTHDRITLLTERDLDILAALAMTPLTAEQLCKWSRSFASPFSDARRVRERLRALADVGRVRAYRYATAGPGAPAYYALTPLGYRLLHGPKADLPGKNFFLPIGIARQRHSYALAEFLTHTIVCAHASRATLAHYARENAVALKVGESVLAPDSSFQLVSAQGKAFNFFVEIDNRTERVQSEKQADSWERKARLYEAYADQVSARFRVLLVTTGGQHRLSHMLAVSHHLARNPRRSLAYGICLPQYLSEPDAVLASCWRDHRGTAVPLLPAHSPRPQTTPVVG